MCKNKFATETATNTLSQQALDGTPATRADMPSMKIKGQTCKEAFNPTRSMTSPRHQGLGCTPRQVLRTRIQTASWMGKLHEKKEVPASWLRAGPGDENIKQSQIFLLWPPASPTGAKKIMT
ncbi:hypothetical protein ElyMa_000925600 [Elysia marginata]|uniref:Uncharacterized protein n=1 Tax=Elysia marginata TaxID=1093978 RepID=A0AAV4H9A7_9GAST|nr:hypothetical protein ElyMa_000925600 [Elysia marginata]